MKNRCLEFAITALLVLSASGLAAAESEEFPVPRSEAPPVSAFYGYAPGRDSVAASSWFAHIAGKLGQYGLGHATFFEEHPDFFRIRLGHPSNFHRSYLLVNTAVDVPGLTGPGRIIARVRRDSLPEEVKFAAVGKGAFGVRVAGNQIRDLFGEGKVDWDYRGTEWADWILELDEDGKARFYIEGGPSLPLSLPQGVRESVGGAANYVTFGHKRQGPQRFLDVAELHFLPPGAARPAPPAANLPDGDFVLRYPDDAPHVVGRAAGGELNGWVETFWPDGIRASSGFYVRGKKDGPWSYWTRDGWSASTETYRDGNLDGPLGLFSLNAGDQSRLEAEYRSGEPVSERVVRP